MPFSGCSVLHGMNPNFLKNLNFDNNFDEDDPDSNILIRLLALLVNLKNAKHFKNKR